MKDHLSLSSAIRENPTTVWVSAVALIDDDNRVLVQQRTAVSDHRALWEFPGGKLEPGESPEAAAVREIAEELSIVVTQESLQPVTFASGALEAAIGSRPLVIMLFVCTDWRGVPKANIAAKLAWTDPAELSTWPMPPLDYPLAEALVKFLASGAI